MRRIAHAVWNEYWDNHPISFHIFMLGLRRACLHHSKLRFSHEWYTLQLRPQLPRPFTTSRPLLDTSDSDEPKIRWYEQLLPWSTERRRVDPNGLDADQKEEAESLRRQIQQIEAELQEMENPPAGKTMIEPLLVTLSPEDQQKVRDAIMQAELDAKRKELEVDKMNRRLAKLVPKPNELEIRWQLPPDQLVHLRVLNTLIQKSASNFDEDLRKKLWKSYARCKALLPPFLHLIPEKSWAVLWTSHHTMSIDHPQWASRLVTLAEDMLSTGKELKPYQNILYIEGLLQQGCHDKAISQWQKLGDHLGEDVLAVEQYELLGVRLFASNGDPERAEKIALEHLKPDNHDHSQMLIPILGAWAQRADAIGIKHAWALYLRFKAQVGDKITMKDYDNITMRLLKAGMADLALAVFKDMMLTGDETGQGSMELYGKAAHLIGKSQSRAISPDDLNKISLTALIALPKRFENKWFYASWLKKLIGTGELDAAATVIELMYERGVRPDAKHLSGLIGAWMRNGKDSDKERAEKMAWAMVHERLEFVRRRGHLHSHNQPDMPSPRDIAVPRHLRRTVSPASIETFCLLLQHYAVRGQDDNVKLMQDCLAMAEIPPNSYFNNQLLYVGLRKGQHQTAWHDYRRMFDKTQPDLETFLCLWQHEKAHLDSLLIRPKNKFPDPRSLMSSMMNWYSSLRPQERRMAQEDFSMGLHHLIIRCFGQAADLEGIIAALYAMRESFGLYPDDATYRTLKIQVGRMAIGEDMKTRAGRSKRGNPRRHENTANISQALGIMIQQREVHLAEAGVNDLQQCAAEIQQEEVLFVITQFLRAILRRTTMDENAVDANIEKAAWDMGVSGIRMDDPLPSHLEYLSQAREKK